MSELTPASVIATLAAIGKEIDLLTVPERMLFHKLPDHALFLGHFL